MTATNATFKSNSTALRAKGVQRLHFVTSPYETTDPPVNVSSSVKPGKVTTRLLTPYTAYRLSVRENSTKGPAIQLGTIKTWPTGIEHFFIFSFSPWWFFLINNWMCAPYFIKRLLPTISSGHTKVGIDGSHFLQMLFSNKNFYIRSGNLSIFVSTDLGSYMKMQAAV